MSESNVSSIMPLFIMFVTGVIVGMLAMLPLVLA